MSNQSEKQLRDACSLVENLGSDMKKKIVKMAVDSILNPY